MVKFKASPLNGALNFGDLFDDNGESPLFGSLDAKGRVYFFVIRRVIRSPLVASVIAMALEMNVELPLDITDDLYTYWIQCECGRPMTGGLALPGAIGALMQMRQIQKDELTQDADYERTCGAERAMSMQGNPNDN